MASSSDKVCRITVQQCLKATLRFQTDDPSVDINQGMVIFVCFLDGIALDNVKIIVKSILNAKLCEKVEDGGRESVLSCKQDILIIPQATLGGKLKGKAVQYHGIVDKTFGRELFDTFVNEVNNLVKQDVESNANVKAGVYGARQILSMETNGPFTHIFDY